MYLSIIRVCPFNMLKKCKNCDKHCFSYARVFLITILRDPISIYTHAQQSCYKLREMINKSYFDVYKH